MAPSALSRIGHRRHDTGSVGLTSDLWPVTSDQWPVTTPPALREDSGTEGCPASQGRRARENRPLVLFCPARAVWGRRREGQSGQKRPAGRGKGRRRRRRRHRRISQVATSPPMSRPRGRRREAGTTAMLQQMPSLQRRRRGKERAQWESGREGVRGGRQTACWRILELLSGYHVELHTWCGISIKHRSCLNKIKRQLRFLPSAMTSVFTELSTPTSVLSRLTSGGVCNSRLF